MFTAPQKRLLNESNDLASLKQQEQSLRKNLVKIPDANSQDYRQVYAQWKTISDRIKAIQQPQKAPIDPAKRAEAAAQRLRNANLGLD
jgi:hypothetical protein